MSAARAEGRRYPGQWVLGKEANSSARVGMPKDWSKRRLPWCQSRNGSQLGERSRVKGMCLSVMVAEELLCGGELLLTAEQRPLVCLEVSLKVPCASQQRAFIQSQWRPPLVKRALPSGSSHSTSQILLEGTRMSICGRHSTRMESKAKAPSTAAQDSV